MPDLSLIVPTLNEAANLPELVRRADAALREAGWEYELIVVDDGSTDGTQDAARRLSSSYPVRLIERGRGAEGGLSGAVLVGFAQAQGDVLCVIDADLQHPPETLPRLLQTLHLTSVDDDPIEPTRARFSGRARVGQIPPAEAGSPPSKSASVDRSAERDAGVEMVVGSRYVAGGSVAEKWGGFRKLNSLVATWLARPFAGSVRDPMSGFFALPRHVFERGRHLSPLGYKILLELMCKCRPRPVAEVPIHFAQRHAGDSKLTLKEQFRYLEHLSRLYDYSFPRASPIVKFAIVVSFAWLAGAVIFALLLRPLGPVAAVALAYACAILVAAVFHLRYVRTQRRFLVRPTPWRDFAVSALAEWLVAVVAAAYLALRATAASPWELFVLPFAAATLVRYVIRKELLLDVRGLRPEERLAAKLGLDGSREAFVNEAGTEREAQRLPAAQHVVEPRR